jgi:hypothetical protein
MKYEVHKMIIIAWRPPPLSILGEERLSFLGGSRFGRKVMI